MRWRFAVAAAVIVAAGIYSAAQAADLAVLLEKGVYLEKSKGDLDGAIEAYKQIVKESEGDRRLVAEAHYRLGECYTQKGQRPQAAEAFEKVVSQFADQTALTRQARARLEELLYPDMAGLMPADTILYVEMSNPGKQIERILESLKGTALENPLSAMGSSGPGPGGKSPAYMLSALLNPSMLAEFKKIRGLAFAIPHSTDVRQSSPDFYVVLYPGESDALRGILTAALAMAGQPGAPIEGMQTFRLESDVGAAMDQRAIILAKPISNLAEILKRYRRSTKEPSLLSANAAFAKLPSEERQRNTITLWADFHSILALNEEAHGKFDAKSEQIIALADLEHMDSLVVGFVLEPKSRFIQADLAFRDGFKSPVYDQARTAPLAAKGFEAVPQEAIALVSTILPEGAHHLPMQAMGVVSIGPEVTADMEQVTLFALPPAATPEQAVLAGLRGRAGAILPNLTTIGMTITSRDPAQTRLALHKLFSALEAATHAQAKEPAPAARGETPSAVEDYRISMGEGPEKECHVYVGQAGNLTVLALSRRVLDASLEAAKDGKSVLAGGLMKEFVGPAVGKASKLALVNVGGALRMAEIIARTQKALPEPQLAQLKQLADACAGATAEARTEETADSLHLRLSLNNMPPANFTLGPTMQLAQFAQAAWNPPSQAGVAVFNPGNVPIYWKAPPVVVTRSVKVPVIDGALNDAAWARPPDTHGLHHKKGIPSDIEMDSWATYDDNDLYLAFRCPEDNPAGMHLTATYCAPPILLCNDDCVQVAIAADAGRTAYYKFIVTGKGVAGGYKMPEKTRVTQFFQAVGREAGAWTCEIIIPWKALKMLPPTPGEKIGVQFARTKNNPIKGQQMRVAFPIRGNAAALAGWPDTLSGTLQFGVKMPASTKPTGEAKKTVTVNEALAASRVWVYELPQAEGRDEAIRYIEQMRDKFTPGGEIIDAAGTDDATLREKLRGGFRLYTTLGEKSKLLRLATEGLGWEFGAGQVRQRDFAASTDNIRIIMVGRNPWSDVPCVIYAAISNQALVHINSVFHGSHSYHIFRGTELLKEGSYEAP